MALTALQDWAKSCESITIQGRGGTNFTPVFRYVEELRRKGELKPLKALLYFTDGDGVYPRERTDYQTAFVFLHQIFFQEDTMGYIMDLRAYVGHRPLIQVGAAVFVEDAWGRLLLQRRSDNHLWGHSAAGSMEPGESAEETARRELLEETGLTARKLELLGVFSGKEEHYIYPNGDEVYNVVFEFLCREWSGELKCQAEEVDELRFFAPEELPENLSDEVRRRLPLWLEARRG